MNIPKLSVKRVLHLILLSIIQHNSCNAAQLLNYLTIIGLNIPSGTLYPTLQTLRREKLIEYTWNEDVVPATKCYEITQKGIHSLEYLSKEWKRLNTIICRLRRQ